MSFELKPISKLFIEEWFQAIPFLKKNKINATKIKSYFENYIDKAYCRLMLGDECTDDKWKSNLGPKIEMLAFLKTLKNGVRSGQKYSFPLDNSSGHPVGKSSGL